MKDEILKIIAEAMQDKNPELKAYVATVQDKKNPELQMLIYLVAMDHGHAVKVARTAAKMCNQKFIKVKLVGNSKIIL